jgi:D-glycero-alpha-D-manno-heptose 1-phosphate guanylyltransferase
MSGGSSDGIDAIVLAGGFGSRLREALPDRQKVTAPIGGKPFLSKLIDWLTNAGVGRIVLAAGHRASDVEEVAAAYAGRRPAVSMSVEPAPLGTGGAARLALQMTGSDPLLVLNGDSFANIDLAALRGFHAARHARISLALVAAPSASRYGLVETDSAGAVCSFSEKPAASGGGAINAGIYLFERAALSALPQQIPMSLERDVFPRLINHGLYAMLFDAAFIDIGTPESLQAAAGFFSRRETLL